MIRRNLLIFSLAVACAVSASAATVQDQAAEIQDIMQLVERGVSDDLVVKHIEARGFVFTLTEDDLAELRDRGVSEAVLDAMLATANVDAPAQTDATENFVMQDDDPDLYFYMSPGYFTPWYRYPVAWGFYYDPFPYYYSSYYYPVFYTGWGWYGHCNYWSYGPSWCDPGWYNDCVAYRGRSVNVPRNPATRWESGRGMPGREAATPRARSGQPAERVGNDGSSRHASATRSGRTVTQPADRSAAGQPVVHHPNRGSSRYVSRMDRNRVRTATPARRAQPTVRPGARNAPRTAPSRLESARVPRFGQVPRSSSSPSLGSRASSTPRFGSSPTSTPRSSTLQRSSMPARSSTLSAARAPHFGGGNRSASWGGGSRASAPRAGGSPRGR